MALQKKIVHCTSGSIFLYTGQQPVSFARTHTAALIDSSGLSAEFSETEQAESCTFAEFTFDGTQTADDGTVLFAGTAAEGTLLSDLLEKNRRDENENYALYAFTKIIDKIIEEKRIMNVVGAGGIVMHGDKKQKKAGALFLPADLFELCAQNNAELYAAIQGKYIYKGLAGTNALLFMRAAAAYKALSGNFPFEQNDTSKRQEDIFDANFLPIQFARSGLKPSLASSINAGLRIRPEKALRAGRRTITDTHKKQEKFIAEANQFNADDFLTALSKKEHEPPTEEQLRVSIRKKILERTKRRIVLTRFFRRNKKRILCSAAALILGFFGISNFLRENAKLATSAGLTAEQTTAVMYTLIHRADVPNLKEIAKGRKTNDLILKTSGFFVSAKQRLEADAQNGTVSPAQWFFYKRASKNWMYGISHLVINGIDFPTESPVPQKKDKNPPVQAENEIPLKKGDKTVCKAEYYLIRQNAAKIAVDKASDNVTLRWNGNRWLVTDISGTTEDKSVRAKTFIPEYFSLLESPEMTVHKATEQLRRQYEWIPGSSDMKTAAEQLAEEFGSIEAENYLNGLNGSKKTVE